MSDPLFSNTEPSGAPLGRSAVEVRRRSPLSRLAARAALVRRYGCPFWGTYVKNTEYAVTLFLVEGGRPVVGKYFTGTDVGLAGLAAERMSFDAFGERSWRMPVTRWHRRGFSVPRLADEDRLDVQAQTMSAQERLDISVWALNVLLEIYEAGYVHGDLQPHNVWFIDGRPVVTDFETFGVRTPGIPFLESGDITGNDPAHRRLDPAFDPDDEWSFHHVLGVSLETALANLRARLASSASTSASRLAHLGSEAES